VSQRAAWPTFEASQQRALGRRRSGPQNRAPLRDGLPAAVYTDATAFLALIDAERARMKAEAFGIMTQEGTSSMVLPLHEYAEWCAWAGRPIHDPMTGAEAEGYLVFLDVLYRAYTGDQALKGSSVPGYLGGVVRDAKVRHDGLNYYKEYPTLSLMAKAVKRRGANRGEKVEAGEALTCSEKNAVVERYFEWARDDPASRKPGQRARSPAERWTAFTMGCLSEAMYCYMFRVGEATDNQSRRAWKVAHPDLLSTTKSSMAGLNWEHARFFDEQQNEIYFEELRSAAKREAAKWIQFEWLLTKMDPYARGSGRRERPRCSARTGSSR